MSASLVSVDPARSGARSTALLKSAVRTAPRLSTRGLQERLFAFWFNGLVYNQIWEDPIVDAEALRLGPSSRVLTIASAGCNVLNYLVHRPESITAVDLNLHHLSVTRLKLACMRHLPDHESMFRFWGIARDPANVEAFHAFVKPHLDSTSRQYWLRRSALGRERVELFRVGFYRRSRLGRLLSAIQRSLAAIGRSPEQLIALRDDDAARAAAFDRLYGSLYDARLLRWVSASPLSVFNLGIPPEQFRAMRDESGRDLMGTYRHRTRRLICGWSLDDNYFAWQALGRRYDVERRRAVPPYLKPEHRDVIRKGLRGVRTELTSTVEELSRASPGQFNTFVFLDSQDWMTPAMIERQWREIARVSPAGGRIIFRTAAAASPIETSLPADLRSKFEYQRAESHRLYQADRSAIYGGFHLYVVR
ncbi:MAG: DUF3419 family protein [Phycisphaerales bacterium]